MVGAIRPAAKDPVQPEVPLYPPPVIVAPQIGGAGMPPDSAPKPGSATLTSTPRNHVHRRE